MKTPFDFFDQFLVLSPEAKELISETIDYQTFRKNTIILNIGVYNKYMYIIKKGIVRGFIHNDKEEVTLSLWMENETFGDISTYITGAKTTKAYEALEDLEVYTVEIASFRALFEKNHEICNLGRIIVEQFVLKTERLKNALRFTCPEDKLKQFIVNRPGLISRVKLKQIASYLNITPETLSRIRKSNLNLDSNKTKPSTEDCL